MAEHTQNSIGIMQGRVVPKTLERLQVFPEKWEEEFLAIKGIGFDYIELLDDKENKLRNVLSTQKESFFLKLKEAGLRCSAVCADQLCAYSLVHKPSEWKDRISDLLTLLEGQGNFTIVVPFFDENKIKTAEDFKKVLTELALFDEILTARGFQFALEVSLPADDIVKAMEGFEFKVIGICYDIGNSIGNGFDVTQEIQQLGRLITHVHVKDKENGKNVRLGAHVEKLAGAFQSLRRIQYAGVYTLETCITPNPIEEANMNIETTKKLVQES